MKHSGVPKKSHGDVRRGKEDAAAGPFLKRQKNAPGIDEASGNTLSLERCNSNARCWSFFCPEGANHIGFSGDILMACS
jgi:hypothetical protein